MLERAFRGRRLGAIASTVAIAVMLVGTGCTTTGPTAGPSAAGPSADPSGAAPSDTDLAVSDARATIEAIARDIRALRGRFPQLRDFSVKEHCDPDGLSIVYAFHTHAPTGRGGWTAGVPSPDPDGVWFHIDLHDPSSTAQIHTQPIVPPLHYQDKAVMFLILEGSDTHGLAAAIDEVLRKHGVADGPPPGSPR